MDAGTPFRVGCIWLLAALLLFLMNMWFLAHVPPPVDPEQAALRAPFEFEDTGLCE